MDKLKIGIIGFGRIGAEHAGWISASGAAEVVAVCDPTPMRLEKARQHPALSGRGVRLVDSWQQLIDLPQVQAVLVSTPSAMHSQQVTRALSAGRHVMVEKPMALDLPAASAMVAAAAGRTLSVFHNRRWDADYLRVRAIVQAGVLGKLINVESRLHQYASCVGPAAREYRPNWRNEAAFGGGGLYDWGSHFVDQFWQLMLPARPVRVFAQLRGNVWSDDCDDFARLCVDFDSGAVGLLEINCTTARPLPRWHLDGVRGSADSPSSLSFDVSTWADLSATPAPGSPALSLPLSAEAALNESEIWRRFALATHGRGEPAVTARSVLPTMLLLDAARQSSRLGQAVDVAESFDRLVQGA